MTQSLTRRSFLITATTTAGGMAIGTFPAAAATVADDPWAGAAETTEFTPWLAIEPNGEIVVRVTSPDFGNGVLTQVPLTMNEELHGDWSMIRAEFADTNRNFREDLVYSSVEGTTTYFSGRSTATKLTELLLQVGASARERLKAAAAQSWDVPVAEISAENSILSHGPTGRTLAYGEMAEAAAGIQLEVEPTPKPRSEWRVLGKVSTGKLQDPEIVNGSLNYGIDVQLEGKVYAALKQSPVHGGKLKSFDKSAVMGMPGVLDVVVVDPDEPRPDALAPPPFPLLYSAAQAAVAVIAEHYWQARTALEALPVEWEDGYNARWTSNAMIRDSALAAIQADGDVISPQGRPVDTPDETALKAIEGAETQVEFDFFTPYADQAQMEPLNGTAMVREDRVDVWMPTQHTELAHIVAAQESGRSLEEVHIHQTFIGGAFGRRYFSDDTRMVVAVAKAFPGRPVHTIWSREETATQGRYRPMTAIKMKAGLSKDGTPTGLLSRFSGFAHQPFSLADTPYMMGGGIPIQRVEKNEIPIYMLVGAYRGPWYNVNAFAVESFMDELAHAAGADPLDYRLNLLKSWPDKGWEKLLTTLAERAEWGKELPEGQAMGLAICNFEAYGQPFHGSSAAAVARIELSKDGALKVLQLDVGVDVGTILNADAVLSQIQGGTIFGLNMALNEEVEIENGLVISDNFDSYPMVRMADIPTDIRVHLDATSWHERMGAIGEAPVGPIAPAIANAIRQITGKRITSMPFRNEDLSWG